MCDRDVEGFSPILTCGQRFLHQSSSLPTLVGGRLEVKQKGSSALFPPCTLLANLLKHGSADTKQSRVVPVTGWVAPSDNRVSHKNSKKPEAFPDSGFFFQDLARYARSGRSSPLLLRRVLRTAMPQQC